MALGMPDHDPSDYFTVVVVAILMLEIDQHHPLIWIKRANLGPRHTPWHS